MEVNGTTYKDETPKKIINIIEQARESNRSTRLRFAFGDTKTGRDWQEVYDICGYIGRSTGSIKVPLLIHKINSLGGGAILDHCIVRIERKEHGERSYTTVYRHPKYHK